MGELEFGGDIVWRPSSELVERSRLKQFLDRHAKVMRRVIRAAYLGQDSGDLSALLNPEAVTAIQRLKKEETHEF